MLLERYVRLFRNGRNQALRIPRDLELPGRAATLRKEGARLIVEPVTGPSCEPRRQARSASLAGVCPRSCRTAFSAALRVSCAHAESESEDRSRCGVQGVVRSVAKSTRCDDARPPRDSRLDVGSGGVRCTERGRRGVGACHEEAVAEVRQTGQRSGVDRRRHDRAGIAVKIRRRSSTTLSDAFDTYSV